MNEDGEGSKYTDEQKIVSAVWVHERFHNNQTWKDIFRNFRYRFNAPPPAKATLLKWENKLFSCGSVDDKEKTGRPVARLMHVPYVRASLNENPNLSLRERARELGLPRSTLLKILQEDLNMVFEVEDSERDPNKRHALYNNGQWKKRKIEIDLLQIKEEPSTSKDHHHVYSEGEEDKVNVNVNVNMNVNNQDDEEAEEEEDGNLNDINDSDHHNS